MEALHAAVNETIRRALVSLLFWNRLVYGKRPDGMSLIPWPRGLPLLWDFTCSAQSTFSTPASDTSWQANTAESAKIRKHSSLIPSFHFSSVCVETLGTYGSCVRSLVRQIGSQQSGDNGHPVLIQKIATDVQRGNAASVIATIPSSRDWAEFAILLTVMV